MYFIQKDHPLVAQVIYNSNGTIITEDPGNPLYQDYLAWLADGNEPQEWQPEEVE